MTESKPAINMPQEQTPPKDSPRPALSNGSQGPSSSPSSRFRMMAMGAMRASESPSMNGGTTNGSAANGSTTNGSAPPEVPLPPAPSGSEKTQSSLEASPVSDESVRSAKSVGSAQSGPLNKSKLIYNIARTKMLTQRTLYRLSSETGFIKLRSKPTPKPAGGSGASTTTGHTAESAARTNGTQTNGTEADAGSVANASKPVVGWKEQGLINSGKKAAPTGQPTMFDALAVYVEMLDQTGMWRNCAGVFCLMFLTYVLTALNFGIVGFAIAAVYGTQWYRNSITRYRRAVKDDIERAYERGTITRTLESVGWLNEFVTRFWLMFEPSLSRMVIDIVDPILAQSVPGFLDSLRLSTFTLGTKAPRINGVRTYSELEDRNQIVMDWHASFTPNDLSDVPPVLRENRVNPKVVLTVRVGKGFIGAEMPILVEDMVFKGKMQVKLQLGPVFPHVRTAEVCFLERPSIDFSLKPVGGETLGFDIAHIPGLHTFILDMMHSTLGPMFYAPNRFTIDVEQLISGAVANIPSAKGVLIVHMHSARGLPKMDTFGKADPYVKITTVKHPELTDQTKTIEKTLSPSWDQKLFLLIYSKTDTVQMEVYDWNNVGKDDKIGFVTYPMQKLLEEPEVEGVTLPIKMGETERGHLTFDMSYFPVSVRTTHAAEVDAEGNPLDPSAEAAMGNEVAPDESPDEPDVDSNTGLVRLFLRSASNLAMTPALARKLCVRAEVMLDNKVVISGAEVKNTDVPSWEIGKELFVADRDRSFVTVRLIDTGNNRTIGSLKLKLDDALAHQAGDNGSDWYALTGHAKGQIRVNVKWRPIMMDPDVAASLSPNQGKRLPGPPIGFVKLTCHEGRGLKNVEAASGRKSDPYMAVVVQNELRGKTRYIANTLDPVWNETLFVPVHRVNDTLALECFDWNRVERDKPLGDALLKVARLMGTKSLDENGDVVYATAKPVEMWASLRQRNGKIKGEVRFRAAFVPVINFDDMLTETERARGTVDMKINDGGLVLGEEEPSLDTSSSSSSSSSSSDEEAVVPRMSRTKSNKQSAPNVPRAAAPVDSIFSGMSGSGGDGLAQTLGRYPRLPNIDYTQFKAGVISVATIGCRGLVRPFAGVFVTVFLNGNRQAPVIETSPSRRRGREHMWEDEFSQAAIPEAQYDTLMFEVKCQPPGVDVDSDEMIAIGKVEYPMAELLRQKLVNTPEPVWLPLDAETGEVLVLIRYDPVEDPELLAAESITDQGMVRMRLASATNLPAADKSGTSDPYVAALIDGVKVWESETHKKTLNPRFNEQAEVGIRQRAKTVLTLEVYDWNQIQSHTLLGTLTLPLRDLPIGEAVEKSYALAGSNGKAELQLKFLFKPGYVEQHDDSSPVLLNVAHTVVKAPVTVIKGGASIVGNVVGGIFGKISGKKHRGTVGRRRGGSGSSDDLPPSEDRKLSAAAIQAMGSATNMPRDDDGTTEGEPATAVASQPQTPKPGAAATTIPMPRLSDASDAFSAPGNVYVTIMSAETRDHRKHNMLVSVSLNHKTVFKTAVKKDVASAVWESEQFELPVLQGGAPELLVALKDHSSFRGDKTVAEFAVSVFGELKSDVLANNGARGEVMAQLESDVAVVTVHLEFVGREGGDDAMDSSSIIGSMRGKHSERHNRRGSAFSRKSLK